MSFSPIPELIDEIRAGRMIVMLDDEDRENEGDLVMAAELVRPEDINFMAREARGLICLSLTAERCKQLRLPPMVQDNASRHRTAFTVSIEAAEGVSTGISAYDRAHTIRTAVRPNAKPDDLHQPGHVFPLQAQPGGVLMRAGHTEAAVDLALLAGLEPAGVIVEIMSADGTMARRPELEQYAARHGLKIGTIADLIRYRAHTEATLTRVFEREVQTRHGAFRLVAYRDRFGSGLHYALVRGSVDADAVIPVRVHLKNLLVDVLMLDREDLGISAEKALATIAHEGRGVFVLLGDHRDPEAEFARLTETALPVPALASDWRQSGLGAQILADLGVRRLRVIGTQRRFLGLSGFGLEVVDYAPPES
ncbi:MAG: 3,4-dihydroxy-2-butanone-4-phosphate synthase [Xanthomonadales bacterium]|nr:3,4-dihydroxy-2-butanone-4-phosphate synthase [Xanthomonadales bacterium]